VNVMRPSVSSICSSLFSLSVLVLAALTVALALAGAASALGEKARVDLKGRDGRDLGKAKFIESSAGILIRLHLKGLPPGPHGLHVHETGKCEGNFDSAGGIVNPLGNKHGFLNEDGPMAGDLPNILIPASGELELDVLGPFLTLSKESEDSLLDADGAALIISERADDYMTDPNGNAGARIGCGVVAPAR
jgi:superoxide dismutase, Cu-Zn family